MPRQNVGLLTIQESKKTIIDKSKIRAIEKQKSQKKTKNDMKKNDFAFDKMNFILLAIGMAVVVVGFVLMAGSGSTEEAFNPDIFSAQRIKVAPIVCFAGFCFVVYGIMHKPKTVSEEEEMKKIDQE